MRHTYVILVHKNPQQMARLVRVLAAPETSFIVHVDRRVDQGPFAASVQQRTDVQFVQNRVSVLLFSYRVVEAELRCLAEALDQQQKPDFITLISGQTYPIRPVRQIQELLAANPGRQFIEVLPITRQYWHERIDRLYFNEIQPALLRRALNKAASFLPRRAPIMPMFGGGMWVTLTADCATFLLQKLREDGSTRRFLRRTHLPEELFVQSLVMNSAFAETVINDNLHHIRWQRDAAHPDVFNETDFDELTASGKWFARKFDMKTEPAILDRIDAEIHKIGR